MAQTIGLTGEEREELKKLARSRLSSVSGGHAMEHAQDGRRVGRQCSQRLASLACQRIEAAPGARIRGRARRAQGQCPTRQAAHCTLTAMLKPHDLPLICLRN